jgi:hypothetical protein
LRAARRFATIRSIVTSMRVSRHRSSIGRTTFDVAPGIGAQGFCALR